MVKLVGDSDGEVKILSRGWQQAYYIPFIKAYELAREERNIVHDEYTLVYSGNFPVKSYLTETVYQRDSGQCIYCKKNTNKVRVNVHPLLGGKRNSVSNSIVCCGACSEDQYKFRNKAYPKLSDGKHKAKTESAYEIETLVNQAIASQYGKDKNEKIQMYCDASYRSEEQRAVLGNVLVKGGAIIHASNMEITDIQCSNAAEFCAVKRGIELVKQMGVESATLYTDNRSVRDLLKKEEYKNHKKYKGYIELITELKRDIDISIEWISRNRNTVADKLTRQKKISITI